MAGRGRGRGRGSMSFSVESLGFGRGEAIPGPMQQPPPLFPLLEFKPVPLVEGDQYDYMLALKQEYRGTMRESPFYIKPLEKKRDIERYSDKYQLGQQDAAVQWQPDWSCFPSELRTKVKKRRLLVKAVVKPSLLQFKAANEGKEDITKTLENLEKKEQEDGDDDTEEKEAKDEGEEIDEDEYYDEEEMEEETDYNLNYFDNGEGFGMDEEDDNLDDGPIY